MASSSSAVPQVKKHDVFLSFRGVDTRYGFTSHLDAALRRAGIETFIDDNLDRGDIILSTLLSTIQNSTICVIIFSRNYANSRWCLIELETILQYKNHPNVIPVFYQVKPNHVRHQIEDFGKAFDKLKGRYDGKETLDGWRTALKQVADISGFDSDDTASRKESELVDRIVKRVLEILNRKSSYYNNGVVGVQSSVEKVESLLGIGSEENLRMVGIWGMGGIGKTTIAKEVYYRNKNRFEKAYFAQSVREELENRNPQNTLQQKILSAILNNQNADINEQITKEQLHRKNVLILLDDVKFDEFIKNFINCLSSKSRIIMTTRNKQVLTNYGVHIGNIYKVEGLLDRDALELFTRFALGQNDHSSGFPCQSEKVVKYAKGVPLALIELGKHLVNKNEEVWKSKLRKLEVYPHMEIQDVLESSLNGLDSKQRDIFLDIACFLRWEDIDLVMKFLDASGFFPKEGIEVLIDRCLITLSNNKITMHDLLQVMGWGVVRNESPDDPKQRSRLCHHVDIVHILNTEMGANKIKGICLDMSKISGVDASPASAEMKELRLFKLHNSNCGDDNINKVNNFLGIESANLKYLCWHGCPLRHLQSFFQTENLVVLDISHSKVKQFWTSDQRFDNLKHINLSHSQQLVKITNLSGTPNLETLILEGCTELREICSSIENLNKLVMLNLRHCKSLRSLPNIWKLVSLEDLHLLECSELVQNALTDKIKDIFLQKTEHPEVRASQTRCICFPGTEIHDEWFTHRFMGSSITLPLDSFNKRIVSFALCAIVDYGNYQCREQGLKVGYDFKHGSVVFHSGTLRSWDYGTGPCYVDSDHVFLCFEVHVHVHVHAANNRYNNEMTIQFFVKDLKNQPIDNCEVKRCGYRLLDYQEVGNPADGAVYKEEEKGERQHNRRKSSKFHKKLLNFLPCTRPAGQHKVETRYWIHMRSTTS